MKKRAQIYTYIEEGEHLRQDFKHSITDSKKIARTIVAFANTSGGRLLIGVKDNGKLIGINTDEEYYMVEAAAQLYSKPEVHFKVKTWSTEGKIVLEIQIEESRNKPHLAPDKNGKYKAYIRVKDKTMLASSIQLRVWKRQKQNTGTFFKAGMLEKTLLNYLNENDEISLSRFKKLASISHYKAGTILVNLVCMNIIKINHTENKTTFSLCQHYHQTDGSTD